MNWLIGWVGALYIFIYIHICKGRIFQLSSSHVYSRGVAKFIDYTMSVSHYDLECSFFKHVWFRAWFKVLPTLLNMVTLYNGQHSCATNICFFLQVSVTFYKLQNHFIAPFCGRRAGSMSFLPLDVETMVSIDFQNHKHTANHQRINHLSIWAYYCILTYPITRDLEPIFFPRVGWE